MPYSPLLLMVEHKNRAAFDRLTDKFEPIQEKIVGGDDAARKLAVQRLEIRRILGEKTTQELILKYAVLGRIPLDRRRSGCLLQQRRKPW